MPPRPVPGPQPTPEQVAAAQLVAAAIAAGRIDVAKRVDGKTLSAMAKQLGQVYEVGHVQWERNMAVLMNLFGFEDFLIFAGVPAPAELTDACCGCLLQDAKGRGCCQRCDGQGGNGGQR